MMKNKTEANSPAITTSWFTALRLHTFQAGSRRDNVHNAAWCGGAGSVKLCKYVLNIVRTARPVLEDCWDYFRFY